ncbi:FG-GAP repeat domain-containing protein [Streptomyces sp. NPDC088254]|uniref:FG-GAP repeat domain-containing protein n=1 Tax=Streptomyces sp. NPDC088254 TaxID=3365847 RepID=UPI00381F6902
MGRNARRSGGPVAALSALTVAITTVLVGTGGGDAAAHPAAGTATTTPSATARTAAATTEITLADPVSDTPRTERPLVAGRTGYLHRQSGVAGLQWTDYASGATVVVETADGVHAPTAPCATVTSRCRPAWYGSGADLVALPAESSGTSVTLWNPVTRGTSTVTSTQPYRALAGETVVTARTLVDFPDGKRRERAFTGDRITVGEEAVAAADARGVLVADNSSLYYLDVESAVATLAFTSLTTGFPVLSGDRFGWYDDSTGELRLKSRTDAAADPVTFTVPYPRRPDTAPFPARPNSAPVLTGDRLLLPVKTYAGTTRLTAVSLTDGSQQDLLPTADGYLLPVGGDEALVSGGTGAGDWWTQRVSPTDDGALRLTKLFQVPAPEYAKTGLALSRGSLRVAADSPSTTDHATSLRTLTTDGSTTLTASPAMADAEVYASCPYPGTECAMLWGNADDAPDDVYLTSRTGGDAPPDRVNATRSASAEFGTWGGRIVDVSDDYVIYESGGSAPVQYVTELNRTLRLKRTARAAAVNGPTLWSATGVTGQVTSYHLDEEKTLATLALPGAGCVPTELQAAGRWLYWACGTASAGVYDTRARTAVPVTPGDVLLGDGYTVRHDHTTNELVLTEAATGATRVLASRVPETGLAADRRYRWTVDEYTGLVAWTDLHEQVHVSTTGVTPSAPTVFKWNWDALAPLGSADYWVSTWRLSRPVTSWTLTLTSVQSGPGTVATRTLTGGPAASSVMARWNGLTANGVRFPNGPFRWSLAVTGLNSSAATSVSSGSGSVRQGLPVRQDYGHTDGIGDLHTLNTSGGLTLHTGTGTGTFAAYGSSTGWAKTITAVPVGDLSGDRCNDMLIRLSTGALRLYKPRCDTALTPSTPYTTLGASGWNQYDVLTAPGDVTKDGRPDLIARNTATGAVYLYKGTSTGTLAARVQLYANWKAYKRIVGVGDLNGDGVGDLLAQDKANNLFRWFGTGKGTFGGAVKLAAGWGGSYNAVVGVGDINRDGRNDIVARDTAGSLYRHYGDGKGSFLPRTLIAKGWGGYRALL